MLTPETALALAKDKLGGPAGIASHFDDLTPQAVSQWKRIPVMRVRRIAALLGKTPSELRPDLAAELAAA